MWIALWRTFYLVAHVTAQHSSLLLLWAGGLLHSSGRGLLTIANWSLGTTAVVLSISFYTVLHFLLLILVSLPSSILMAVTNRLRGRPPSHPKHRRKRISFSSWLANLVAPLPFLPHRFTDLLPTQGADIPLPNQRWFRSHTALSNGLRCISCGKAFPLGQRQHVCRRKFDSVLGQQLAGRPLGRSELGEIYRHRVRAWPPAPPSHSGICIRSPGSTSSFYGARIHPTRHAGHRG